MRGHAPAGAETLLGMGGALVLTVVMLLAVGAFVWFFWPEIAGREA